MSRFAAAVAAAALALSATAAPRAQDAEPDCTAIVVDPGHDSRANTDTEPIGVTMTRDRATGRSMGNVARARIANRAGAALFVRIHADGSTRRSGIVQRRDLTGFNWSDVPVVLAEIGFMTNPSEDRRLNDANYQQRAALGLARGIERFAPPS